MGYNLIVAGLTLKARWAKVMAASYSLPNGTIPGLFLYISVEVVPNILRAL